MKVGKPKSKRVPVRLRHKIQKASAAKQKKDKKLAKKNPEWRSRIKKDPGIPNLFPYKDKILHEIEEKKRQKEEETQRKKEENRVRQQQLKKGGDAVMAGTAEEEDADAADEMLDYEEYSDDAMEDIDESNPMAALLASAEARAKTYNHEDEGDEDGSDASSFAGFDGAEDDESQPSKQKDSSRRAFNKSFQDLLSDSDVILYVLDARDPLGTRSRDTELAITSDPDKRLIFVLNKIDLIPPPTLNAWLKYLRRSFPTLPLRASSPAANAKTFDHKALTPAHTAKTLFVALKTYAASRVAKRALSVGVAGYPNVGKSSVVNALVSQLGGKRSACPVGAEAGVTTSLRQVKIDSKLKLIDSPGIVFPSTPASSETASSTSKDKNQAKIQEQARLVLLNAIPPREIEDPAPAVTLLLSRMAPNPTSFQQLLAQYDIPFIEPTSADLTNEFLIHVARKRGRLGRGGVPNLHAAGMAVVSDWRDGRIQGWMEVPTAEEEAAAKQAGDGEAVEEKKVVDGWAEEFKIDGLWG